MELPVTSTYYQYHTPIVFGQQCFILPLISNNMSVLVIYFEDYLRNTMSQSADIPVCSMDT
jgi:hypothetical protein